MKRQCARDENTVKRGKFLAVIAGLTASSSSSENASHQSATNASENFDIHIVDDVPQLAHSNVTHSTPLHSNLFSSTVDFGNLSPVLDDFGNLSPVALFGIDAQWNDNDKASEVPATEDCLEPDGAADDQQLYPISNVVPPGPISVEDLCTLLVAYQWKNKISNSAMAGICKLIKTLLPTPNNCPGTFGIIQQKIQKLIDCQFGAICSSITWICGSCWKIFRNRKDCIDCCDSLSRVKKPQAFFQCNLETQLKMVVENFSSGILKFLNQTMDSISSNSVCGMISGEFYQNNGLPNPHGDQLILHLLVNVDGAKFTKSKTGSFWLIDAQIVELPLKLRVKFENSILFALWQGESKPDWNLVLRLVVDELLILSHIGFVAKICGRNYFVRVRVLATVFDLPAAASIWNTIQWNGRFGCMHCKEPGPVFNRRRIWPYTDHVASKDSNFWRVAYDEITSGVAGPRKPYFGVKGKSILADLKVDPYQQNPLDIMHQAYEGVVDKILDCLFGTGKHPWCIGKGKDSKNLKEMDALITCIKFPVDFQRRIPSLENLSYFKASKFKNLLLYGLVPALAAFVLNHNVSDQKVTDFIHWIMLYHETIARLNTDFVQLDSLDFVDRIVKVWQQLFPYFVGEENQTYNSHATRHLTHFV